MTIICLVTNDLSHDQRMERICTSLAGDGHEVTLVGRRLPDSPDLPTRPYRQYRITCRYHRGKRFYAEYNYRLWRELRPWQYRTVCAVDLDTLPAARLLCNAGQRLVYDAHEWFSETPEVCARPIIRGIWRGVGRALVPRTDARYTVGPRLAERLSEDYGAPFRVIRNLPRYRSPRDSERQHGLLLYQGMLNPGRGIDLAIRALPGLPRCRLLIVGKGPEQAALKQLAERCGVAERVEFTGFKPPRELAAFTDRAWLGINMLAASSKSYFYSLANKSLDYVQGGLPSIQMDYPEYRSIQQQYGCYRLVADYSVEALERSVRELLDQPERYAALREGCRRAAEQLNWEREEARLLEVYRRLV